MFDTVYFDGAYKPKSEVNISPDDRGFLFGDGAYEVVVAYKGRYFRKREHLERLNHSLRGLRITGIDAFSLEPILDDLMVKNEVGSADVTAYIQITRGVAARKHDFPSKGVAPTVFVQLMPVVRDPSFKTGVSVITVPDTRWSRCDIKSINLLPNCLANQLAREAGCIEAIFVRDGVVLEGTLSSFFAVFNGVAHTAPKSNYILAGVTRQAALDICKREGIPCSEEPIYTCVGDGDIDYEAHFKALVSDGYEGYVSLETHWRLTKTEGFDIQRPSGKEFSTAGEEASRKCLDYIRKVVSEL